MIEGKERWEVTYKGILYKTRPYARTAVFLDALGVEFRYLEDEELLYLPDFNAHLALSGTPSDKELRFYHHKAVQLQRRYFVTFHSELDGETTWRIDPDGSGTACCKWTACAICGKVDITVARVPRCSCRNAALSYLNVDAPRLQNAYKERNRASYTQGWDGHLYHGHLVYERRRETTKVALFEDPQTADFVQSATQDVICIATNGIHEAFTQDNILMLQNAIVLVCFKGDYDGPSDRAAQKWIEKLSYAKRWLPSWESFNDILSRDVQAQDVLTWLQRGFRQLEEYDSEDA